MEKQAFSKRHNKKPQPPKPAPADIAKARADEHPAENRAGKRQGRLPENRTNKRQGRLPENRTNKRQGRPPENRADEHLAENRAEGRHSVLEALRAGAVVERLFIQKENHDGPIQSILQEAKKRGTTVDFVPRERLDRMSSTGHHQGVIAYLAAFRYQTIEDMLALAKERGEEPFLFLLDGIEDPHNLGAIIRTANLAGAHGVILPKRRAVGLTAAAVTASAGAVHYTPVAKVTNLSAAIEQLKEKGIWFVCADMEGEEMYRHSLTGAIALVIGSEGHGVSRLVKEHCDYLASIPMQGDIDSLNASVAAGVLAYEIVRQRRFAT